MAGVVASSCQIGAHVQAAILLLPHLFKLSNYKLVTKHNLINYLKQTYLNDHPKCCTLIILKKTQWQLSRIFWLSSQDYLVITFVLFRIHYTENRQIEVFFNRINRIWSDEHNMSMSNTFKCQITAFLHTFHFFFYQLCIFNKLHWTVLMCICHIYYGKDSLHD